MAHQVIIQLCASFGVYLGFVGFGVVGSLIGYATQRSSLSPGHVAAFSSAGSATIFAITIWFPIIYIILVRRYDFIQDVKHIVQAPRRSLRWIPVLMTYAGLLVSSNFVGAAMLYKIFETDTSSLGTWEPEKFALIGGVIIAVLFYLVGVILDYSGYGTVTPPVNPALPPPLPASIPPPPVATPGFTYPPSHQLGR